MRATAIMLMLLLIGGLPAMGSDGASPYTFGVVPQFEARRIVEIWEPILDRVADAAGIDLTLVGSADIPAFERELATGKLDFAYMNPYHLVVGHDAAGYLPLVRDVGRTLFGIIVVHRDSSIQAPADLDGKTVAFPAPNALGASLLVRAELDRKFQVRITPRYVSSHTSVYLNVVTRQTDAGGGVRALPSSRSPRFKTGCELSTGPPMCPPHPVAVHPRVDGAVRERVRRAFIALGEIESGRRLLAAVPITRIGPAEVSDYEPLRAMRLGTFYEEPFSP